MARLPVPEDKVSWSVEWADYAPQDFTAPFVQGVSVRLHLKDAMMSKIFQKEWADPDLGGDFNPEWNSLDKSINRVSHEVGETWCSLLQQQPPPLGRVLIKCKGGGH